MLPLTNCYHETIKMAAINFLSKTANLQSDELKAYQWAEISEGRFEKFFLRFSCLADLREFLKTKERILSNEFFWNFFKNNFFQFWKKILFFEVFDFFLNCRRKCYFLVWLVSKNLQFLVAYWSAAHIYLIVLYLKNNEK